MDTDSPHSTPETILEAVRIVVSAAVPVAMLYVHRMRVNRAKKTRNPIEHHAKKSAKPGNPPKNARLSPHTAS